MSIINAFPACSGGSVPVVTPLSVTENGTYSPPAGVGGFSPVTVNVAPTPKVATGSFTDASSSTVHTITHNLNSKKVAICVWADDSDGRVSFSGGYRLIAGNAVAFDELSGVDSIECKFGDYNTNVDEYDVDFTGDAAGAGTSSNRRAGGTVASPYATQSSPPTNGAFSPMFIKEADRTMNGFVIGHAATQPGVTYQWKVMAV